MPRYALIACPKCREHAQIIETQASKTTKCQKCGSSLKLRKLRVFYISDNLDEVIARRTALQAKLHGDGSQEMLAFFSSLEDGPLNSIEVFADRRAKKTSKAPKDVILDLLIKEGGSMYVDVLRSCALEYMEEERFDKVMKGLLGCGELYAPSNGVVRIV